MILAPLLVTHENHSLSSAHADKEQHLSQQDTTFDETCFQCQQPSGEWISMQYCLHFCDKCVLQLPVAPRVNLDFLPLKELTANDLRKLSLGGNKRFRQFLQCLSYLKGYHFETPSEIYTAPSVLYYRDVLQDEHEQRSPRSYDEDYYDRLSVSYSNSQLFDHLHLLNQPIPSSPLSPPSRPRSRSRWAPDHSTSECMLCNNPFTLFNRRHHCRTCGLCLCEHCAPSYQRRSLLCWSEQRSNRRQCRSCLKRKALTHFPRSRSPSSHR
jgi:hypothetical protein